MWTYFLIDSFYFFEPYLTSNALDWKSVQFEHDTNSLYALYPGNQASISYFFEAASFKAPDTMLITLYGRPKDYINSSEILTISSCSSHDFSGAHKTNCSILSN